MPAVADAPQATPVVNFHTAEELTSFAPSDKSQPKEKKQKQKKAKQPQQNANVTKPKPKVEKPFYQSLGEQLFATTQAVTVVKALPPLPKLSIPLPPIPTSPLFSPVSKRSFSLVRDREIIPRNNNKSTISLASTIRKSEDSNFSGETRYVKDEERASTKYKVKGTIYSLHDFEAMAQIESLILRYGGVPHMGVRDPSYIFWMNRSRSAVVHFKVLDKVAVLGGDPLCHAGHMNECLKEFRAYCKQIGWKTAIIGASSTMAAVAKANGWTTMQFGTETVLNPQTNEVLLGKSGKRTVTQCRQLLDPARGGISIHTYCPSMGRDEQLECDLRTLYDDWRNERNTTRENQAFVTVFDMFAMANLMTFLYTKDKEGKVNGFAALRKLGANNGYHIDPFIQASDAPRGVSDLLVFASLALLNVQGCTYLSLGYEPLHVLGEISGLPSLFHSTTRKVHQHVFGKIPVGGKETFFNRWKPDTEQDTPLYLVFVGRVPSPRYMVAMCHYTNISLRQIFASDFNKWMSLKKSKKEEEKTDSGIGSSGSAAEN